MLSELCIELLYYFACFTDPEPNMSVVISFCFECKQILGNLEGICTV